MFRQKTTFVIGAGASKEARLPIGSELAVSISRLLHFKFERFAHEPSTGDQTFFHAMRIRLKEHYTINEYLRVAEQMSEGVPLAKSIDSYIDNHRDDDKVAALGKAAIAYSLLKAERDSDLWLDPGARTAKTPLQKLQSSWYFSFGRQLTEQVPKSELKSLFDNVSIICFNYDRCIEEFLKYWLHALYAIDLNEAERVVKTLNIIRPYGKIADLSTVAYGNSTALPHIFHHSQNINTFSEQVSDEALQASIGRAMTEAQTIIFLGFGFHPPNMEILRGNKKWQANRILASAHSYSHSDAMDIKNQLISLTWSRGRPPLVDVDNNCTCARLFSEYSRALNSPT